MNPGGLPENSKKVDERGLGDPLFTELCENLRRMVFMNSCYFVTDTSFTADGGV